MSAPVRVNKSLSEDCWASAADSVVVVAVMVVFVVIVVVVEGVMVEFVVAAAAVIVVAFVAVVGAIHVVFGTKQGSAVCCPIAIRAKFEFHRRRCRK